MFDEMTFAKVVGGFCGSLLVYMLGVWAADELYHVGGGHGDHHDFAYVIEVEDDQGGAEEEAAPVDFATVFASADIGKGERVWGKCRACHKLEDGANGTGPYLSGVVGRDIGAAGGFNYSGALNEAGDVWTPENLNAFLENPKGWAPGTSMSFAGLKALEDRANLIAFLQNQGS